MLIDATHPEETRVVVVDGNKVEEFDFESSNKRQLSGNIYLAKVTRVEPSLQAAFVEYGGNRHGFLAFSEIHPDYYQIPLADREALLAAQEAEQADEDEDEKREAKPAKARGRSRKRGETRGPKAAPDGDSPEATTAPEDTAPEDDVETPAPQVDTAEASDAAPAIDEPAAPGADAETAEPEAPQAAGADASDADAPEADDDAPKGPASIAEDAGADGVESVSEPFEADAAEGDGDAKGKRRRRRRRGDKPEKGDRPDAKATDPKADAEDVDEAARVESVGAEDAQDEAPVRRAPPRRYKIQEVVKVRQIMLVQVVKEERGNKGAALTTYLSLAGRYCVLMPNTARGGGISRKITSAEDRKKLKEIAAEFEVPRGMGIIIRTAGSQRTKAEIKRDYEFLLRQWEEIRELTLKSVAPALIYEEGSLIKRSIRDLYSKDIEEILVEGDEGYREAKDYMRMLMPSHAKNVQPYKDAIPLFSRHQVESYLAAMFNPVVQLKSGGYIVIGVTEALVAIDVNSGRSTREGSIEETALKTNLEAADEVARQLRLRDLAGLIVIDFIDMDERKNNAAVEKRMKERLASDRARIQIGRISAFGLMEMSRQRLRPGMLEASTAPCPHCHGSGLIRSQDSLALSILRAIEEEAVRRRAAELRVVAPVAVANYLINQKRRHLLDIEARYDIAVAIEGDPALISPDHRIERVKAALPRPEAAPQAVRAEATMAALDDPRDAPEPEAEARPEVETRAPAEASADARATDDGSAESRARRRRGKRGGRRRRREDEAPERRGDGPASMAVIDEDDEADEPAEVEALGAPPAPVEIAEAPAPVEARNTPAPVEAEAVVEAAPAPAPADTATETVEAAAEEAPAKPKRRRTRKTTKVEPEAEAVAAPAEPSAPEPTAEAAPAAIEATADAAPAAQAAESAAPTEATAAEAAPTEAAMIEATPTEAVMTETPTTEAAPTAAGPGDDDPDRPRRRGWWSLRS
jgi:ribonuclease E